MPIPARLVLLAVALAAVALPAAPAAASQIVFQCGGAVCAVDPDTGEAPRTLTASGRVAGVTDDGRTAGWVEGSSLVVRPIAAGGATGTIYSGEIYDFPLISPDGTRALWSWYFGGYGWYTYLAPGTGTSYPPAVASSTYQTSHGWMGSTVLVARRGYESNLPRLCAEAVGGPGCDTLLATEPDASTQISFPDGNRAGTEVVAVRGPEGTGVGIPVSGRLSVYAGGTRVRDLTTGPGDAYPSFSYEGDRVAFQRGDGIYVMPAAGGSAVRVATGSQPYWGGARTVPSGPGPSPTPGPTPTPTPTQNPGPNPTPSPGVTGTPDTGPGPPPGATPGPVTGTSSPATGPSVRSTALRYRKGRVAVQVRCAGARTCTGTLRLSKGKTVLGSRSYAVRAGRSVALSVTPTRTGRRAIARSRTHRVTVQLRPKGGKAVSRTVTRR